MIFQPLSVLEQMSIFYLIRHGSTDTAGHILTGRTKGVHLNARGLAEAAKLPQRFANVPLSAIFATPLERTQETAAPLAARSGLTVEISEEITEVDYGDWTGRLVDDLRKEGLWQEFNSFRSLAHIPGGESMLQIQARVIGFLGKLHHSFPDGHIAIISHGDPIKTAVLNFLGMHLDMLFRIDVRPASVTIVRLTEHEVCVLALNTIGSELALYTQ